jgi:hypothetical protein
MPDDPYGDPYSSPYAALMPLTVQNPELAQKFVSEHQAAIAARNKEMQDVQQAQQMNTDKMAKLLDDTAAKIRDAKAGQSNLPLIALGANMMGPGDFGTQLGRGLRAMVPAIQQQREADQATDLKLADLDLQKTKLQNLPLDQRLRYIQALQTGDINALRAIEAAQVRSAAAGAGQDPSLVKEWKVWRQTPGNEGKTLEDYMRLKQGLQARSPADIQEYNLWKSQPGNADKSFEDYLKVKPQAHAAGAEQGKEQAQAMQKLPSAINAVQSLDELIDKLKAHPGLDSSVGSFNRILPVVPGSARADFEALVNQLKGQQFLTAFDTLRGAGAITEIEGEKATGALGNPDLNQSKEQFLKQLEEMQKLARRGIDVGRQKAGIAPMKTEPPPTPRNQTGLSQPGEIVKGGPAVGPDGTGLKDGRIAIDPATKHRLVVRNGVWVEE